MQALRATTGLQSEACLQYEAVSIYRRMVRKARATSSLLDDLKEDSDKAAKMRGYLLGLAEGETATWEELKSGRLVFDLQDCGNVKIPEMDVVAKKYDDEYEKGTYACMRQAIELVLKGLGDSERALFEGNCDNEIPKGVVLCMFGLTKPKDKGFWQHVKKNQIDYEFRKRVVQYCIEGAYAAPKSYGRHNVSPEVAEKAFFRAQYVQQPDLWNLTDGTKETGKSFHDRLKILWEERYWDSPQDTEPSVTEPSKKKSHLTSATATIPYWKNFKFSMSQDDPGHPIVVPHEICDGDGVASWYKVVHYPLSHNCAINLLQHWNKVPWLPKEGAKKGGWIRCVSDAEACEQGYKQDFVVGRKSIYPCDSDCDAADRALFSYIRHALDMMKKALKEIYPNFVIPNTLEVNIMQMLAAELAKSNYDKHNDFTFLIGMQKQEKVDKQNVKVTFKRNKEDGIDALDVQIEVMPGVFLPNQDNMVICTVVMSNDPNPDNCYLEISDRSGKVIGTVPLSNFCCHWQGPKANREGWKHAVRFVSRDGVRGDVWRISITFRLGCDPVNNADVYKERLQLCMDSPEFVRPHPTDYHSYPAKTGVLSNISGYVADACGGSVPLPDRNDTKGDLMVVDKDQSVGSDVDLNDKTHTDRFSQLKKDDYFNLIGHPIGSYALAAGPLAKHLTSHHAIRRFLCGDNGGDGDEGEAHERKLFLVDVIVEKQTRKRGRNGEKKVETEKVAVPVLHQIPGTMDGAPSRLPLPGERLKLGSVCADANLVHSNMAHPIYSHKNNGSTIVILSEEYKNDPRVRAFLEKCKKWKNDETKKAELSEAFEEVLAMFGNGGIPENQGEHPLDQKKYDKNRPIYVVPEGQKLNSDKNSGLMKLWEEKKPFALYVNETRFLGETRETQKMQKEEECTFLGFFYVNAKAEVHEDDSTVVAQVQHRGTHYEKMSYFRMGDYLRLHVSALFGTKDWNFIEANNNINKFNRLQIPMDCEEPLLVEVPIASVNEGKITREQILYQYIREGRHLKFQVAGGDDDPVSSMDDEGTRPGDIEMNSNTKASAEDIVRVACVNQYAGAVRYLGGSVLDENSLNKIEGLHRDQQTSNNNGEDDDSVMDVEIREILDRLGCGGSGVEANVNSEPDDGDNSEDDESECEEDDVNADSDESDDDKCDSDDDNAVADSDHSNEVGAAEQEDGQESEQEDGQEDEQPWGGPKETSNAPNSYPVSTTAIPLHGDDANWLTQGAARNATPMSNRGSDKNVQFFLEEMERRGMERKEGCTYLLQHRRDVDFDIDHYQAILESMFGACLFRVLGRTNAFRGYAEACGFENNIPKMNQLDDFLKYMHRTVNGSKSNSMSPWISSQHQGSIPSEWHKWAHFQTFAKGLKENLPGALEAFYKKNKEGRNELGFSDHWCEARDMLADVLATLSNSKDKTELQWLAQAILGDMCEHFTMPFGACKVSDVVEAYGSKSCSYYMRNMDPDMDHDRSLQDIIDYVHDPETVPGDCLTVLGYYRDNDTKVNINGQEFEAVRSCINGRQFDAMDAEHIKCKFYLHVKFTAPNYRRTLQPRASAPHCWPERCREWANGNETKTQKHCKQVMHSSRAKFREIKHGKIGCIRDFTKTHLLTMSPVVVLPGEEIPGEDNVVVYNR